jgi:TonB family protein
MPTGLLLAFLAAQAAAATPSKAPFWRVDWGDARCILARDGADTGPTLAIRYVPGDRRAEIWVLSPHWGEAQVAGAGSVKLVLDTAGAQPVDRFRGVRLPKGGYAFATQDVASDFFYAFQGATSVSLQKKGREVLRIPLPDAAKALAATRACEDDLLKRWGVDPIVFHSLRTPARADPSVAWASQHDYPQSALAASQEGTVYVRVNVAADGRVTACNVVVSSGVAALDETTCALQLRRGRYRPAIGAEGRPVAALNVFYVTWRISG